MQTFSGRTDPLRRDPDQVPDVLLHGDPAPCIREMGAVRAEPAQPDVLATSGLQGVHLPDIVEVVQGAGMVRLVHLDGVVVVVHGDVDVALRRLEDAL